VYGQLIDEFSLKHVDGVSLLYDYINHFHKSCIGFSNLHNMLTRLKKNNIKLAIVSNGFGHFQSNNIKSLRIEHYFDAILISEWEEVRKPDKEIFMRALNKLGATGDQSLFVGDHPDNDIAASRAVGMKAVWKRNSHFEANVEADAVIDDLEELIPIVFEIGG